MSKIIDITDKLAFDEKPRMMVKGKELEINTEAENMIKIMAIASEDVSGTQVVQMCELILTNESKERLKELQLSFKDYMTVVNAAVQIASGSYGEDEKNKEGE